MAYFYFYIEWMFLCVREWMGSLVRGGNRACMVQREMKVCGVSRVPGDQLDYRWDITDFVESENIALEAHSLCVLVGNARTARRKGWEWTCGANGEFISFCTTSVETFLWNVLFLWVCVLFALGSSRATRSHWCSRTYWRTGECDRYQSNLIYTTQNALWV